MELQFDLYGNVISCDNVKNLDHTFKKVSEKPFKSVCAVCGFVSFVRYR